MENGIVNVSAALPPEEFEIHVCCLARGGEFVRRFPYPERVHVIGKREGFSLSAVAALSKHIRQLAPHVIHTHNFGPLIYARLAAPGAGSRILHGEHAELTDSELAPHRLLARRMLYRGIHRIHTVSHSLRDSLILQGFAANKIDVVVNGVDTARFRPGSRDEARRDAGLPTDATILGLVGRFGAYKRHAELIEAFDRLAAAHPGLWLLFAGSGGPMEAPTRARAAASPFASRIRFAGLQSDVAPSYRALDLLVVPSVNEGLSNALLEAMACGIPVLAHTACGNRNVIEDGANGCLRDLAGPEHLRDALAAVLSNPSSLSGLGQAARRTVEANFSFASMVAGYEKLYRQTARRAPAPV